MPSTSTSDAGTILGSSGPMATTPFVQWPAAATPMGLDLLDPCVAEHTSVVRKPAFLSSAEIDHLKAIAIPLSYNIEKGETTYLHVDGQFQSKAPAIYAKICELVCEADKEHWGLLAACGKEIGAGVNPRCIEYHEYGDHARKICGPHGDTGSLFTVDIMLSHTSEFEGGRFQTLVTKASSGGNRNTQYLCTVHEFEMGDALVFVSHKRHAVSAVASGTRCVLVLEFWEGSACRTSHRCMNPSCGSPYLSDDSSDGESPEQ